MGALLVMDEVQTAFGRTGKMFAFEHFGVTPDILCLAKSFGGGMPLGAFVSSKRIMQAFTHDPPLGHITTFGGHPVSCSAGLAAQKFISNNKLGSQAIYLETLYRKHLDHPAIEKIRGRGLFLAVVLKSGLSGQQFIQFAIEEGLIIDMFLFCDQAFRIAPPLIIDEDEAMLSIKRINMALDRLTR